MYLWLVAAGLSLIFGVMRVLNFAHGSLYMLGAYFAWVAFRISGSFWVALLVGPLLVAAAGWVLEFGFLRRVYSAPEAFQLLLTFAFVLTLDPAHLPPLHPRGGRPGRARPLVPLGEDQLRPSHPRHRRRPRDGPRAGRPLLPALHGRLRPRLLARGPGRCALHARACHLAGDGRVHHHRGLRGGGAGRAGLLARRLPRRGADRTSARLRAALHAGVRARAGVHGHCARDLPPEPCSPPWSCCCPSWPDLFCATSCSTCCCSPFSRSPSTCSSA